MCCALGIDVSPIPRSVVSSPCVRGVFLETRLWRPEFLCRNERNYAFLFTFAISDCTSYPIDRLMREDPGARRTLCASSDLLEKSSPFPTLLSTGDNDQLSADPARVVRC